MTRFSRLVAAVAWVLCLLTISGNSTPGPTSSPSTATLNPTSPAPSRSPTLRPVSSVPTASPTAPTKRTKSPVAPPTVVTKSPTSFPTLTPSSSKPTSSPTSRGPTPQPIIVETNVPTPRPRNTKSPTPDPSASPTIRNPTSSPTSPTPRPRNTRSPTFAPSASPTVRGPTSSPTEATNSPVRGKTRSPTEAPVPTIQPSKKVSNTKSPTLEWSPAILTNVTLDPLLSVILIFDTPITLMEAGGGRMLTNWKKGVPCSEIFQPGLPGDPVCRARDDGVSIYSDPLRPSYTWSENSIVNITTFGYAIADTWLSVTPRYYLYVQPQTRLIDYAPALFPRVDFSLSKSTCGNIYISYAASSGSAISPFHSATWRVTSRSAAPSSVATIQGLLQSASDLRRQQTSLLVTRIGNDSAVWGADYIVTLELQNWLKLKGTSTDLTLRFHSNMTISVLDYPIKDASQSSDGGLSLGYELQGPTGPVPVSAGFVLYLKALFADDPAGGCNGSVVVSDVSIAPDWMFLDGPFPKRFAPTWYLGMPSTLLVLGGVLPEGNYTFGAFLDIGGIARPPRGKGKRKNDKGEYEEVLVPDLIFSVSVVEDSQLTAVVGGNRTMLNGDEAVLSIAGLSLRDGSQAVNFTVDEISWMCRQTSQQYLFFGNATEQQLQEELILENCSPRVLRGNNRKGATLSVLAESLDVGLVYLFSATLPTSSILALPAFLAVVEDSVDATAVQIVRGPPPRVNVDSSFALGVQAQKKMEKEVKFIWKQLEGDLTPEVIENLAALTSTGKSFRFPPGLLTGNTKYSFMVSALGSSADLFAIITFLANDAPSGGYMAVEPAIGFAGVTDFAMEASLFSDPDLPLLYSFVVTDRDCISPDAPAACFRTRGTSIFSPLTPFFTSTTAVSKLQFSKKPQSLGVIAQDALGANSPIVLANHTIIVARGTVLAREALRNAGLNPQDGSKSWTDSLSTLSLFSDEDIRNLTDSSVASDISRVITSAKEAAVYSPDDLNSLVLENQIPAVVAQVFPNILTQSPVILRQTTEALGSVLDRAQVRLNKIRNLGNDGIVDSVDVLSGDSLASTSVILESLVNSTNKDNVTKSLSLPNEIVSKLTRVQMVLLSDPSAAASKVQLNKTDSLSALPDLAATRTLSSKNINASFLAQDYRDFERNGGLQIDPSESAKFVFPSIKDAQLTDDSVIFAAASFYRINPYDKFPRTTDQRVSAAGVASLEVFEAVKQVKLSTLSQGRPLQIVLQNRDIPAGLKPPFRTNITGSNRTRGYFCGSFDEIKGNWSTFGCSLRQVSAGTLTCECNHTTDYTAWAETLDAIVDTFTDLSKFDDIGNGWVIVLILVLWAACTLLFLYLGDRWDDRDMKRRVRSILLSLKMRKLRDMRQRKRVFQAWRCEVMKMDGTLVDSGAPLPPALSTLVSLERRNRSAPPTVAKVNMRSCRGRLKYWFSVAIWREHTVLNTIYLLDAFLTRPMRVLCGAAVILGEMFASAIFYAFDQDPDITPGTQVLVAILSVFIVSPVIGLFVLLTRRVAAMPGAQRQYLQQMMVVLIAELGEDRVGDDVKQWAKFARVVSWEELEDVHKYQGLKARLQAAKRQKKGPERDALVRALQGEVASQKQNLLYNWKKNGKLVLRRSRFSNAPVNEKDVKSNNGLVDIDLGEDAKLPVSPTTWRWLTASPTSKKSNLNKVQESAEPEIATAGLAQTFAAQKQQGMNAIWTPRPFHVATPRRPQNDDREEDETSCCAKFRFCSKRYAKLICCRPTLWLLRSKPSTWNHGALPPPETDFKLSARWIYVCYFLLLVYYCIAFFYVLAFGFRAKNWEVAKWIPTVAFSIFLDLIVIQPCLIFLRYALMNEIAWQLEEGDFSKTGMLRSWRSAVLHKGGMVDGEEEDVSEFSKQVPPEEEEDESDEDPHMNQAGNNVVKMDGTAKQDAITLV